MMGQGGLWSAVAMLVWEAGALACALAAGWLMLRKDRYGGAHASLVAGLIATGGWALCGALAGPLAVVTGLAESARNLVWLFALYRLFAADGRHASMRLVRPILMAVAFVEFLYVAAQGLVAIHAAPDVAESLGFQSFATLRLLVTIGGLVLVHNLYGAAGPQVRLVLRWPGLALAVLWAFDLNYNLIASLSGDSPSVLAVLRGVTGVAAAGLIAFGAQRGSEQLRFRPSHAVAFQSLSLLLIGGYLVAMIAIAQWLAFAGSDFAALMQLGFVVVAAASALGFALSSRMRGWLRVMLAKHLFKHRFDYRAEWLRLTRTMGQVGSEALPLGERAVRALADITESPGGMLLTDGGDGALELAVCWQWPTAEVPVDAVPERTARAFEASSFVADLDALRAGPAKASEAPDIPEWLLGDPRAWAIVPLLHFDRLVGMVVLARPAYARRLDWEDFDLLRVAGRQLASYLAENAGQEALAEASRFDDFHRRIAFVMHDIKNLASQLSLLARNAELHADNPEFRGDMLVTLRNSSDKLNTLLQRLSRYGSTSVEALGSVRADDVAKAVVAQFKDRHPVSLVEAQRCDVMANRESLEQVLVHLIQNAVDASGPQEPIFVRVAGDGLAGVIEVVDSGSGMSADFVRSRLFRPFVSTKQGGFGIGAYEARELVRAMRGRLDVDSREGLGSRFTIRLPLAETAALAGSFESTGKKVA